MTNHPQLWPEGKTFIREVLIPTKDEPFPVLVTYAVPPFDIVVATWQNTDPEKAYSLFRQFIVDWNQQDKLTDNILQCFLVGYPGTDKAIFAGWCEHMKEALTANEKLFSAYGLSIN